MEYSPFSASPDVGASAAPHPGPANGNIAAILKRTEDAVDAETAGIGRPRFDIQASVARKSRCLYELSRAVKGLRPADLGAEAGEGFKRLREKLSRNERAVKAHLDAVGEVAGLLQNAISSAQSDGTYGAGEFGWAR